MKTIKAIIIEDETGPREVLQDLLENFCPNVHVVGVAANTFDAETLIKQHQPDLLFLDIEMPNRSGIEFLKEQENINYSVIFTTAFDKYAIQAIKLSALDYLLKPIDIKELIKAVHRITIEKEQEHIKKINNLIHNQNSGQKIALNHSSRIDFIDLDHIIYCKADGSYTNFVLKNKQTIVVSKPLKEFESTLPNDIFFRSHKSYLVNIHAVVHYDKENYLHMSNGEHIMVARSKKEELVNRITKL